MAADPDELRRMRAALEAAGRRSTRQREQVYAVLLRSTDHPTAEQVFEAVRRSIPHLSLATVYNALEALEDGGLVMKLPAVEGSARFDARPDGHYHFRCLRSGAVADLPTRYVPDLIESLDPGLSDRLGKGGFRVTGYRLEVVGYFEGCTSADTDTDGENDGENEQEG